MVSTFSPNKHLEEPAHGDYVDTWDVPVNADWSQIDKAFGNSTLLNATGLSGNVTLAVSDYVSLSLQVSGLPTAGVTYVVPTGVGGQWVFRNDTTGGFNIGLKSNAGGATVNVPVGTSALLYCDGSATGVRLSVSTPGPAAGADTQVQYNSSGILAGSANLVFDGTTLTAVNLTTTGNTVLGNAAGDTLTLTGTPVSIPNNLNFDSNLFYLDHTNQRVGVKTATPSSTLTVAGTIESTSGGIKFPDASTQTAAAGWTKFSDQSVAAVTNIDVTGIPTTVHNVEIDIDLTCSVDGAIVYMQFYNSVGALDAGANYFYIFTFALSNSAAVAASSAAAVGGIFLSGGGMGNSTAVGLCSTITIPDIQRVKRTQTNFLSNYFQTGNAVSVQISGAGQRTVNGPITGVRITSTGGGTLTGRVTLSVSS